MSEGDHERGLLCGTKGCCNHPPSPSLGDVGIFKVLVDAILRVAFGNSEKKPIMLFKIPQINLLVKSQGPKYIYVCSNKALETAISQGLLIF